MTKHAKRLAINLILVVVMVAAILVANNIRRQRAEPRPIVENPDHVVAESVSVYYRGQSDSTYALLEEFDAEEVMRYLSTCTKNNGQKNGNNPGSISYSSYDVGNPDMEIVFSASNGERSTAYLGGTSAAVVSWEENSVVRYEVIDGDTVYAELREILGLT